MWSNMKMTQRNAITQERQARMRTGGGPEPLSAEVDPDVAKIVPHLLTCAPTAFSSNLSEEELEARRESVFEGDHYILQESLVDECNNDLSQVDCDLPSMSDHGKTVIDSTSSERKRRTMVDVDDIDTICVPKKRPKERVSASCHEEWTLKLERIRLLTQKDLELADLKIKHEKAKHQKEMEFLTEIHSLQVLKLTRESNENF